MNKKRLEDCGRINREIIIHFAGVQKLWKCSRFEYFFFAATICLLHFHIKSTWHSSGFVYMESPGRKGNPHSKPN